MTELDGYLRYVRWVVDKYGWTVQWVASSFHAGTSAFAYTVGLHGLGHPELLIAALTPDASKAVLNQLGRLVRDGRKLQPGDEFGGVIAAGYTLTICGPLTADGLARYPLGVAAALYGEQPPALQVVWPDAEHRYPWDAAYRELTQPLLAPPPQPHGRV